MVEVCMADVAAALSLSENETVIVKDSKGSEFVYYWVSGWDHADILSHEQWNQYLETFALQVRNPLVVE